MVGNAQHFHCTNEAGGGDDKRFYFKTQVSKADNPDRLGNYLPLAHKNGIKVIVYFNVHWYSKEFGREHSDWMQIKEDGKPLDLKRAHEASNACLLLKPIVRRRLGDDEDWQVQGVGNDIGRLRPCHQRTRGLP